MKACLSSSQSAPKFLSPHKACHVGGMGGSSRCPSLPLLTTAMSSVLIAEKADLGHGMLSQLGHQAKLATSHSACH